MYIHVYVYYVHALHNQLTPYCMQRGLASVASTHTTWIRRITFTQDMARTGIFKSQITITHDLYMYM